VVKCPLNGQEKDYRLECKECDFYHPYTVCTYRETKPICPFDNRRCNSSASFSSIYDCRHDYGFEMRHPKCYGHFVAKSIGLETYGFCRQCGQVFVNEHEAQYHGLDQLHWCSAKIEVKGSGMGLDDESFQRFLQGSKRKATCPQCGEEFEVQI